MTSTAPQKKSPPTQLSYRHCKAGQTKHAATAQDRLHSVTVVSGLVGAASRHIDVGCLVRRELGELGTQLGQVQGCHLLIKVLGQHVHLVLVAPGVLLVPQLQLGNDLQQRLLSASVRR